MIRTATLLPWREPRALAPATTPVAAHHRRRIKRYVARRERRAVRHQCRAALATLEGHPQPTTA